MTDTSLLATTHSTGNSYPVTAANYSPAPNGVVSDSVPLEDEEPYTIKCICAFEDDDGNTVFCEKCETWQHIECYYHGQEVPDEHFCTDCSPKPLDLDRKRATDRQRRLREQNDSGDRKAKRSGSKGHKKKHHKEQDAPNGHHRSDSSSRDQLGTVKKPKSSHRPSASVSSVNAPPKLLPDSRKRSGSATTSSSPTKQSPTHPQIPLYSHQFLHLYDNDQGYVNQGNLLDNLNLAGDMGSWVKDPSALLRAGTDRLPQEIFTYTDVLDSSNWPELKVDVQIDKEIEVEGLHPTWKLLKTNNAVSKDQIVGEVKGKIGRLRDYCLDPSNRWPDLRHPQPFVFFHPQLPIYIDSRSEGSIMRYVRRSCRPNVTLKTYITNGVEYHFCYVANQDISAGSEITAMWYYDRQTLNDNTQEDVRAIAMSNLLANFGGCACSRPQECLLARVDRRHHPDIKLLNGKRKKTKSKFAVSPTSVGPSNASRASSEAAIDDDNADTRSTSGSTRGQTRSRDLTPTHPPPEWALQDMELSARDRRKIAAAEKKFEQLEHDQHGGQRKKKRSSATGSAHPSLPSSLPKQSSLPPKLIQVDTNLARLSDDSALASYNRGAKLSPRKVSDPINNNIARSPFPRASYVDESLQTLSPRIGFSPLSRRLLKRCHEDSSKAHWPVKRQEVSAFATVASPTSTIWSNGMRPLSSHSEDMDMKDSPSDTNSVKSAMQELMPKPPLPSTAAHRAFMPGISPIINRMTGLHVQLPPPQFAVPSIPTPGVGTPGSLQSPSDTLPAPVQTPGGSVTAPSPVKKKMSLGDYMASRGTMATPTTEKNQIQGTSWNAAPSSKQTSNTQSTSPPLSTDGEFQSQTQTHSQSQPQSQPQPQPQLQSTLDVTKHEPTPTDAGISMKDVSSKPPISPYVSSLEMQDANKFPPTA